MSKRMRQIVFWLVIIIVSGVFTIGVIFSFEHGAPIGMLIGGVVWFLIALIATILLRPFQ